MKTQLLVVALLTQHTSKFLTNSIGQHHVLQVLLRILNREQLSQLPLGLRKWNRAGGSLSARPNFERRFASLGRIDEVAQFCRQFRVPAVRFVRCHLHSHREEMLVIVTSIGAQ